MCLIRSIFVLSVLGLANTLLLGQGMPFFFQQTLTSGDAAGLFIAENSGIFSAEVNSGPTIGDYKGVNANGVADSLGVSVVLTGTVTSIDFRGTGLEFFIQDATGGIGVFSSSATYGYSVNIGDEIRVTGAVAQFNGLIQISSITSIVVIGQSGVPLPTLEVGLGETTEGRLIKLTNATLVNPAQWPTATGQSANVDILVNGVIWTLRIDADTDIDGNVPAPVGPFDVVGMGSQFDNSSPFTSGYQILPRRQTDIIANPVIWQEDFSNGLINWTNQGGVLGTQNPQPIWEYRGPNTNPDTATGTRGAYGLNRRIESQTWENGFVIFDSDYLDNGGVAGAFGQGTVPAPHYGELISPIIDLTGQPNLQFEFYQRFRNFEALTAIVLSSNGGASWPDTLKFNTDVPLNDQTAAGDYKAINIPAGYTGQSQFRFKFLFYPVPNTSFGGYYFWQVDDVRLIKQPQYDLAILPTVTDGIGNISLTKTIADNREFNYGILPQGQISSLQFATVVTNLGSANQPQTTVTTTLDGPQTLEVNAGFQLVASGDTVVFQSSSISPSQIGEYDITMVVSSPAGDRDPEPNRPNNNIYNSSFTVSDSVMGIARRQSTRSWGTTSFTNAADGIRLGNFIELTQPDTLTSITIGISSTTQAGALIYITVRDTFPSIINGLQFDFPNILLESDFYTVTAQDVSNGFVTIPIPSLLFGNAQNRVLQPERYLISAELYSNGGSSNIAILDDGSLPQAPLASIVYIPNNNRWFTNGNAFHIWANFGVVEYYDLEMSSVDIPDLLRLADAPFTIEGTITNFSYTTINSFSVGYQIDNQPPVLQNIANANLAPGSTYSYSFPVLWSPVNSGNYNLSVWTFGMQPADMNESNDTISTIINVIDSLFTRTVLYESFTSSTCDTCALGNDYLRQQLLQHPGEYAQVTYLQDIPAPGDPYGTDESTQRNSAYLNSSGQVGPLWTIKYFANHPSTYPCELTNPNKVYMHSGAGTSSPGSAWEHVVGNWGQDDGIGLMTYTGDSLGYQVWSITIDPYQYYGIPQGQPIYGIGMVFRNQDGSDEGKGEGCDDIFVRNPQTTSATFENINGTPFLQGSFNNQTVVGLPSTVVDGGNRVSNFAITTSTHQAARSDSSLIDIDVTFEIDSAAQRVTYDINLLAFDDFTNVTLHTAIIEKTTLNNVKTSADTVFYNVLKKMVPSANGTQINLQHSVPTVISDFYRFKGNYVLPINYNDRINHAIEHSVENFNNLQVIVWLQEGTGEVLQAAMGKRVNINTTGTASATVCDSLVSPSGNYVWTQSGTYLDTIPNVAGFDSIITFTVVVNNSTGAVINPIACDSYTAPDGQILTQTGQYQSVIPNAAGCDSVITVNLTMKQSTFSNLQVTQCGSYTAPNGQTYTQSGQYQAIIPNSQGCDSTITISLTINQPTASTLQVSRCGSYTAPDGQVYTQSGTYQAIIPNTKGCDSVITIQATIAPGDYDTIAPTVCGSYIAPDGKRYTQSGQYVSVLQNQSGCDSVITINLTILPVYRDTIPVTACGQYVGPNGVIYTKAGFYPSTFTSSQGCDSTVVLNLTILQATTSELFPVSCGSYTAPDGQVYSQSGQYQAIIPNSVGCDSVITINLIVDPIDNSVTQIGGQLTANQSNAQYQWMTCNSNGSKTPIGGATQQTYVAGIVGFYAVEIRTTNCVDTSLCYAVTVVGVDKPADQIWSLYPNPTTGHIVLQGSGKQSAAIIRVRNVMGQEVLPTQEHISDRTAIDLSTLPKGMYWVEIAGDSKVMLPVVVQ